MLGGRTLDKIIHNHGSGVLPEESSLCLVQGRMLPSGSHNGAAQRCL